MEPSVVEDRVTAEVAVPPLATASLEAAEAEAARANTRHRAMVRANSFLIFFFIIVFSFSVNT